MNIDPTGESTCVIMISPGVYRVTDKGDPEDHNNKVYVGYTDMNGDWVNSGELGETLTPYSFYDTDGGGWQTNAIITMSDDSGDLFLSSLALYTPSLPVYIALARNGKIYDFKETNFEIKGRGYEHYRGMPIHIGGKQFIASGRDVGNYVAGFIAGYNGLSYLKARIGFDGYQSIKNLQNRKRPSREGKSTRSAQFLGWLGGFYSPALKYSFGIGRD